MQSVTPLLMYGADNKDDRTNPSLRAEPELRASSLRGTLRYWLRAVLGARFASPREVFEEERAILGSTDSGSKIRVRVYQSNAMRAEQNQTVLPEQTRGYALRHHAFPADSEFRITLSTHLLDNSPVLDADGDLVKAVFLMVNMSGLGRRSRRGSGNLRVLEARGYEGDPPLAILPEDRDALANYLIEVCRFAGDPSRMLGRRPDFPVFAQDTAVVLLGRKTHHNHQDAFDELWNISGPYHQEGGIFGDVRPRRASAIHMRVAPTADGYVSQQTILYSGSGQWQDMQEYIGHCKSQGFDDIYGTWEHWR